MLAGDKAQISSWRTDHSLAEAGIGFPACTLFSVLLQAMLEFLTDLLQAVVSITSPASRASAVLAPYYSDLVQLLLGNLQCDSSSKSSPLVYSKFRCCVVLPLLLLPCCALLLPPDLYLYSQRPLSDKSGNAFALLQAARQLVLYLCADLRASLLHPSVAHLDRLTQPVANNCPLKKN